MSRSPPPPLSPNNNKHTKCNVTFQDQDIHTIDIFHHGHSNHFTILKKDKRHANWIGASFIYAGPRITFHEGLDVSSSSVSKICQNAWFFPTNNSRGTGRLEVLNPYIAKKIRGCVVCGMVGQWARAIINRNRVNLVQSLEGA
mmetsp:Transcript_29049/g.50235  ORF Transcript_29049/g.50235 Transcript_29049/m.50235 type:complete len:143 (-) Transcript_29049:232-660(-)